jgi:acetoin utilization deacetylase AcuC-like enzyme
MDLIGAYGLFDNSYAPWMEVKMAEEHDLLLFHTQKYFEILTRADRDGLRFTPGVCFNIFMVMHKLSVMLRL